MSHLYPIAVSVEEALSPDQPAALTRADAERLAERKSVLSLETEWLTVSEDEAERMLDAAAAGQGHEFIQRYENEDGSPVLAITFWRVSETAPADPEEARLTTEPDEVDHTDDLYFRSGRTKKRGPKKKLDPRQMDLFQSSKESD